jgi:hypothetical protein
MNFNEVLEAMEAFIKLEGNSRAKKNGKYIEAKLNFYNKAKKYIDQQIEKELSNFRKEFFQDI